MTDQGIAEAYARVVQLALALGVRKASALPGLWEHDVDAQWRVKLNPHPEEREQIPGYHMLVEFNGWPAGLISPQGGTIAAGAVANEHTFIEAVCQAIRDAGGTVES